MTLINGPENLFINCPHFEVLNMIKDEERPNLSKFQDKLQNKLDMFKTVDYNYKNVIKNEDEFYNKYFTFSE